MGVSPPSKLLTTPYPSEPFRPTTTKRMSMKMMMNPNNNTAILQQLIWCRDWQRVLIRARLFPHELTQRFPVMVVLLMPNNNNDDKNQQPSTVTLQVLPLHLVCALNPPAAVVRLLVELATSGAAAAGGGGGGGDPDSSCVGIRSIPATAAASSSLVVVPSSSLPRKNLDNLRHRLLLSWRGGSGGGRGHRLRDGVSVLLHLLAFGGSKYRRGHGHAGSRGAWMTAYEDYDNYDDYDYNFYSDNDQLWLLPQRQTEKEEEEDSSFGYSSAPEEEDVDADDDEKEDHDAYCLDISDIHNNVSSSLEDEQEGEEEGEEDMEALSAGPMMTESSFLTASSSSSSSWISSPPSANKNSSNRLRSRVILQLSPSGDLVPLSILHEQEQQQAPENHQEQQEQHQSSLNNCNASTINNLDTSTSTSTSWGSASSHPGDGHSNSNSRDVSLLFRVHWDSAALWHLIAQNDNNNKNKKGNSDVRASSCYSPCSSILPLHIACWYQASPDVLQTLLEAFPLAALANVLGLLPIHWVACGFTLPPPPMFAVPPLPSLSPPPSLPPSLPCPTATPTPTTTSTTTTTTSTTSPTNTTTATPTSSMAMSHHNHNNLPSFVEARLRVLKRVIPETIFIESGAAPHHQKTPAQYIQDCMHKCDHQKACLRVLVQLGDDDDDEEDQVAVEEREEQESCAEEEREQESCEEEGEELEDDASKECKQQHEDIDNDNNNSNEDSNSVSTAISLFLDSDSSFSSLCLLPVNKSTGGGGSSCRSGGGSGAGGWGGTTITRLIDEQQWEKVVEFVQDDPGCASRWLYGILTSEDESNNNSFLCTAERGGEGGEHETETTILSTSTLSFSTSSSLSSTLPVASVIWKRLPIHLACINGAPVDVLKALGEAYPLGIATADPQSGRLPLHWLLLSTRRSCTLEQVQYLLRVGPPEVTKAVDWMGRCPLHMAVLAGNLVPYEVFQALLEHDPPAKTGISTTMTMTTTATTLVDRDGMTPLACAQQKLGSDHTITKLLLSAVVQ